MGVRTMNSGKPVSDDRKDDLLRLADASRARAGQPKALATRVVEGGLVVVGIVMLLPIVWMLAQSVTDPRQAFALPPSLLPKDPTLVNFATVFERMPFGQQFLNSIVLAVGTTVGSLFISVLAAYALSRIAFRGSRILLVAMISAMMIPAQLVIIPIYVMMRQVELVDTLWAILLPSLINVFQIFFLTQYFGSIPKELDEAATLDGAGHVWILFRMLVPLSGPALSALGILSFEASWNSYFAPLIFLFSPENMTLPLGLVMLRQGMGAAPTVVVFASITMVVLPVLVVFLIFQRQFVASIATAGLKG